MSFLPQPTGYESPLGWFTKPSFAIFQSISQIARPVIVLSALLAGLGLVARVGLLVIAGNQRIGPLSGVGDQGRYQALAQSLWEGRGLTYAGLPTALRPPLYPVLLAVFHFVFGSYYPLAARIFQFLLGLLLAYLCFVLAGRLYGREAALLGGAFALVFPTLAFLTIELQTELVTTLLVFLFLCFSIPAAHRIHGSAIGMGITSALAMLFRFNCVLLPILGAIVCVLFRHSLRCALFVCALTGLFLAPWMIRNAAVFHGRILYSSHGGINLLQGALSPQGRAQGGESEKLRAAVGWLHTDIETNSAERLRFPSEEVLDRQARAAAISAWKELDFGSRLRLSVSKILWFWLSADQLLDTASFSPRQRMARASGVVTYWFFLAFALVGWRSLLGAYKPVAFFLGAYAFLITIAHLPFVMNTRLRVPFFDPLIAALAAGGLAALFKRWKQGPVRA